MDQKYSNTFGNKRLLTTLTILCVNCFQLKCHVTSTLVPQLGLSTGPTIFAFLITTPSIRSTSLYSGYGGCFSLDSHSWDSSTDLQEFCYQNYQGNFLSLFSACKRLHRFLFRCILLTKVHGGEMSNLIKASAADYFMLHSLADNLPSEQMKNVLKVIIERRNSSRNNN